MFIRLSAQLDRNNGYRQTSENREAKYSFLQIDEETKLNVIQIWSHLLLKRKSSYELDN